ncbi:hypothetical protein FNV43_RR01146 [Rhamnella rubrinervis]|uniref:Uncharacterized protein n=1 Tax=Rhamnella rubrinervis TaxID=2594499 RepID=A0A8K0HRS3_9ROSA|nr:hypothetical protein FNV43_RR01146 [Rhamnella rubrinervis]
MRVWMLLDGTASSARVESFRAIAVANINSVFLSLLRWDLVLQVFDHCVVLSRFGVFALVLRWAYRWIEKSRGDGGTTKSLRLASGGTARRELVHLGVSNMASSRGPLRKAILVPSFDAMSGVVTLKEINHGNMMKLYTKLKSIWKLEKWKLISLGRGYFQMMSCGYEDGVFWGSLEYASLDRDGYTSRDQINMDTTMVLCETNQGYRSSRKPATDVDLSSVLWRIFGILLDETIIYVDIMRVGDCSDFLCVQSCGAFDKDFKSFVRVLGMRRLGSPFIGLFKRKGEACSWGWSRGYLGDIHEKITLA